MKRMQIKSIVPKAIISLLFSLLFPLTSFAAESVHGLRDFTTHWAGILCLIIFCSTYSLVIFEEIIHLRKSKPVVVAAGIIWAIVAIVYAQHGDTHTAEAMVRHNLLEFVELFLFLLAAMTYINTMEDRGVFDILRSWLVGKGFSLVTIFWLTGLISFFLSPIADNLTTALLMAAVVTAVGGSNTQFVTLACINIVVAANAGGAFSPFGDITTLMVWQKGIVEFQTFFALFIPSVVNWLVPAVVMAFFVPKGDPAVIEEKARLKEGAWVVVGLFILTVMLAVSAHNFLHLPPVLGMMTGLGLLKVYSYFLKMKNYYSIGDEDGLGAENFGDDIAAGQREEELNIFKKLARAEWDTLMFFYGVILCVGGLGAMGYLALVSEFMYGGQMFSWFNASLDSLFGQTISATTLSNITVGFLSAAIDNIPVMFAVLTILPDMDMGQWLLVTLTAGVGGSMLSVGSAAGVAVMGQARGIYTFFAHLKWSWVIALGYFASIATHFLVNSHFFE